MLTDQIARARISEWHKRAERAAIKRQLLASSRPNQRRDISLRQRPRRARFSAHPAIDG